MGTPAPSTATTVSHRAPATPRFIDPLRVPRLAAAFPALELELERMRTESGAPGLAVAIVVTGATPWVRGFGVRSLESLQPVTGDTAFRIGSISKVFTATAVMKLVADGHVELEDPVLRYIPAAAQLEYLNGDARPISLRDLLLHHAGLPRMGTYDDGEVRKPVFVDSIIDSLPDFGLQAPPDVRYDYSNMGFQLLGLVVGAASGTTPQSYIDDVVLRPLGMTHTVWDDREIPVDSLAIPYRWEQGAHRAQEQFRDGAMGPGGGLYSTAEDMARFVAWNLAAWPTRSEPEDAILPRAMLRTMHRMHALREMFIPLATEDEDDLHPSAFGQGLGWAVELHCRHGWIVEHSGGLHGYHAEVMMIPDKGVGVVVLANDSIAVRSFALRIFDRLAATGAWVDRQYLPSDALVRRGHEAATLFEHWDESRFTAMMTERAGRNRAQVVEREIAALRTFVGECEAPTTPSSTRDPRRGTFVMACERGTVMIDLAVSTQADQRLHGLWFHSPELPVPPALATAATRLANVSLGEPSADTFDDNWHPTRLAERLDRLRRALGPCTVGEPHQAGTHSATYTFTCTKIRNVSVALDVDEQGRIASFSFDTSSHYRFCR